MEHSGVSRTLSMLDISFGSGQEARVVTVLRAVLLSTEESGGSCTFGDIYEKLSSGGPELHVSKAWIHRILKSLVEDQLIRLEVPDAIRKNYIGNVQTLTSGLETLKERKGSILSAKKIELRTQIDSFDEIECGYVAQELVQELTGKKQIITSRFLRGVDELSRVLKYNFHAAAKKDDIIRMSLMWLGPFGQGIMNRLVKYFESASQGVETRWLVNAAALSSDVKDEREITLEDGLSMMFKILDFRRQGHKIDLRFYIGGRFKDSFPE